MKIADEIKSFYFPLTPKWGQFKEHASNGRGLSEQDILDLPEEDQVTVLIEYLRTTSETVDKVRSADEIPRDQTKMDEYNTRIKTAFNRL